MQIQFEETNIDKQKVILANCFDVMKTWPDGFVDAVLTSPPFRDADLDLGQEYYSWYQKFIKECCRVSRDYIFALNSSTRLIQICRLTEPIRVLNWHKPQGRVSYRYQPIFIYKGIDPQYNINATIWNDSIQAMSVLRFPITPKNSGRSTRFRNDNDNISMQQFGVETGKHPYEDPIKLYHTLLRFFKRGKSQTILDPCLGSGTTLEACIRLDLKGIGIERERIYYDMAIKRLEKFRGQERLQFE